MKALVLNAEEKTAYVQEKAQPDPAPDEVLVKVHAIALNPIDPLYVCNPLGDTGRTVGSDFAGTVTKLGADVPQNGPKVGDRVAGFLQGACSRNERPGAFAEYLIVPWDLVWRVPESISLESAASVSLCGLTAAQVFFYRLGFPAPFSWSTEQFGSDIGTVNILIYGASTSVGLFAAQLARQGALASGKRIRLFGTASKARFPLLQAEPYTYDHLVDYREPSWPEQIKNLTNGEGIHLALDCISEHDTVEKIHSTLATGSGRIAIVRSRQAGAWKAGPLDPEPIYGAVWEGLGVDIQYAFFKVPASPRARDFAVAFYQWLSETGALEPNPIRLMPGDLSSIVDDGYALLGPGTMEERSKERTEEWMKPISAEKLIYVIGEKL